MSVGLKLFENLLKQDESEILDFKVEYNGTKEDFPHDVLSMFNTPKNGEKFLVFGVNDKKEIVGLSEQIDSASVNNFLSTASFSNIIPVQVINLEIEKKLISIVVIPENFIGPIVLKTNKYGLKKDNVYVRIGDTNIGKSDTAPPDVIERILELAKKNRNLKEVPRTTENKLLNNKDLLNLHEDIHLLFHRAIRNYQNWDKSTDFDYDIDDHIETYFYKFNMDFTIKVVPHLNDFREPWAQDALDPKAFSYILQLRYKGTKINEVIYVATDGGRAYNIVPNQRFFSEGTANGTFYYFYIAGSLKHDLNIFINEGSRSYFDRTSLKEFPVFKSEEDAIDAIGKDFKSSERLLLSYSTVEGYDERFGEKFRKFEKYPKYLNGVPVPANEYEKLKKDL